MFAAEGFAKATRRLGVAALTAGPGVTNGISAIAGAQANGSPVAVLGGRAPEMRWGERARCRRSTTSRSSLRSSRMRTRSRTPWNIAEMTGRGPLDLERWRSADWPDLP